VHAIVTLTSSSTDRVLALVSAAQRVDGTRALSERAELALRHAHDGVTHLGVMRGQALVGYAQVCVDEASATVEGVVHPEHRRSGFGSALRDAVIEAAGSRDLLAWAHGGSEAARAFAAASGATRVRRLLQMRRDIDAITVPSGAFPPGVGLRAFRPGEDEDRWLQVNAQAFADHPEQGAMTRRDLDERMAESWFDPAGFLLAEDADTAELLGFHWTKVHPATRTSARAGEVYVVGVSPAGQGRGLGRALMVAGLQHLASPAATPDGPVGEVLLYVEADNEPALAMYTGLRFSVSHVDEQYRRSAG
jgi:mycothiol synthase